MIVSLMYFCTTKGFAHVAGNAIDIAPSSLKTEERRLKFHDILVQLYNKREIVEYLSPYTTKKDPAFHIVLN